MDNQLCFDCAFKHVSQAYEAWVEINNGYAVPDHYMKVVGNLAHAEGHLIDEHPKLANRIREGRKAWWDGLVLGAVVRPPFEKWVEDIWELVLTDLAIAKMEEASNGEEETESLDGE